MQDNEKQSENPARSESDNTCKRCGGTGMYVYMQLASEYAKENDKPHLYGDKDWMVPVGRKCPFCNGGFADDVIKARKSADIPTSFYDKRLKDFDWEIYVGDTGAKEDTRALRQGVQAFIDKFKEFEEVNMGFYIWSRTKGSGKTFLASCICNELMYAQAIKTRFVSASELIDIATSGDKNANDEYKRNPMKLLNECKLLVIDDIGQKVTGAEWLDDILFKLLDYRMTNKRMTLFTSNCPINELRFNERTIDRVNRLSMPCKIPEICVRDKEVNEARASLIGRLGLNKKSSTDDGGENKSMPV